MTQHKEAGVLYLTACPACLEELAIGWRPSHTDLPWIATPARRRKWPAPVEDGGCFAGPATCKCGAVTLRSSTEDGILRAVVEWSGREEPKLRIVPEYGSIRDQV